jgi:hypothetical protein
MAARRPKGRTILKPVREVIRTPKPFTNPRASAAAALLKQTVKGGPGPNGIPIPKEDRQRGDTPGPVGIRTGNEAGPPVPRLPRLPEPKDTNGPNLSDLSKTKNGGVPLTKDSYASWSLLQKAKYQVAATAMQVDEALGGVPERAGNMIAEAPYQALRWLQGFQLPEEPGGVRTEPGGIPSHVRTQAQVGGTQGTPRPVDRSAAIRKAWATRRKLYGSSGKKD